ncbi:MAG: tetratricopeptide repeat protein [Parvibaculaceae bacterium]
MIRPFPAYSGEESYTFVSYAHDDADRVYPILTALHERGFNIWYDEGIEPGTSWRDELAAAISAAGCVLFLVSRSSVRSRNCLKEINFALSTDRDIALAYLEETPLPPALELSLGDEQSIHAAHYDQQRFVDKLATLLTNSATHQAGSSFTKGRMRNHSQWAWALGFILILATASLTWYGYKPAPPDMDVPLTIVVTDFPNLSGVADLDWFAEGLPILVSDQLADSRHTVLVSRARWLNLSKHYDSQADLQSAAADAGIRYIIRGQILPNPDGPTLSFRISDLVAGVDVGARTFEDIEPGSIVGLAKRVTATVGETLNLPVFSRLETLSSDFLATDFAAYQAYVAGLRYYNRFEFDEAISSMQAALDIDPEFTMARARLAEIQLSKSDIAGAQASIEAIPESANLSERERGYIDGLRLMVSNNYPEAVNHFEKFVARFPYDVEGRQFLAESHFRNFNPEAGIKVLKHLSEQEPENHHVLSALGYMSMSAHRYTDAHSAFKRYASIAPELPHPWQLLGGLALIQHDLNAALEHYHHSLSIEPTFALSMLGKARTLAYLGDYDAAHALLTELMDNPINTPRDRISAAFDKAALFNVYGQFDSVERVLSQLEAELLAEKLRVALAYSIRGLAAYQAGDKAKGRHLINTAIAKAPSGGVPTRYLFARGLLELADGEYSAIPQTAAEIRKYALPLNNPDRTEEIAALYLEGRALSVNGRHKAAIEHLVRADKLDGYQYRLVTRALAEAHYQAGNLSSAMESAVRASTNHNLGLESEIRLDLEADRLAAMELAIRIACELGRTSDLQNLVDSALKQWPDIAKIDCDGGGVGL